MSKHIQRGKVKIRFFKQWFFVGKYQYHNQQEANLKIYSLPKRYTKRFDVSSEGPINTLIPDKGLCLNRGNLLYRLGKVVSRTFAAS